LKPCATPVFSSLYTLETQIQEPLQPETKNAVLSLLFTDLGELEIANGVALRLFRKEIQLFETKQVLALFRKDAESGVVRIVLLSNSAYQRDAQMARSHTPTLGTRTLDVLQVASTLVLKVDAFCTLDRKQSKPASDLGMRVP
jgi:hypothetical protein